MLLVVALLKLAPLTWNVDYEPAWAPDSRRIALISSRHGGMKLHLLELPTRNGSEMKQLGFGDDEDDSPSWSPDGKRIAFVRIHQGVSGIFVVNADGSALAQVAGGESIHPLWSPDGRQLLFNQSLVKKEATSEQRVIGEPIDEQMNLATVRPDGSGVRRLTSGGGFTYASYSPDGRSIVYRRQRGASSKIHRMNADGSGDLELSLGDVTDGWPAWSSDGKRIVFSRRVHDRFQLFSMDRDGSHLEQLTDAPGEFTNARWSPDGRTILCSRRLGDITLMTFAAPP